MKFWYALVCLTPLVALAPGTAAETHEKVQAALSWEMPSHDCSKPKPLVSQQRVVASGGTYYQAPSSSTQQRAGTSVISDVDHYQLDRFERKQRIWQTCIKEFKAGLLTSFESLKTSATYGMTQQQAEAVLAKLAQIQAAIESPDGTAPTR